MAMKTDELKKLVDREGLHYFLTPDGRAMLMNLRGEFGKYQVVLSLQLDGRFLQLRTLDYLSCPRDHAHHVAVLELLTDINCRRRFVKFGWDADDGEVMVFGDVWLMDGKITQEQLHRVFGNYFPELDTGYRRLTKVLETGKDPGDAQPGAAPPPPSRGTGKGAPIETL